MTPSCRRWMMSMLIVLACAPAWADGGGGGGGDDGGLVPAEVEKAVAAIQAERYADAIRMLRGYVARSPKDADAFNWLGFAYRKSGQLDAAFTYYKRALTLDPQHRGAHEYVGEAYLLAGKPEMARQHLATLVRLCPQGCEQREDLEKAIAAYAGSPTAVAR